MFRTFSHWFTTKKKTISQACQRFVLVLSGGGLRGFYALGVLKAIEEAGLKEKIDAIYGVSVGAILASYWASGRSAEEIYQKYQDLPLATMKWLPRNPTKYLLETRIFKSFFEKDLAVSFEDLSFPVFIGATDLLSGKFLLFHEGELLPPLLWSMALPGIFPSVKYQGCLLNDGGIINNFPVKEAQEAYPHHQVIGVALSKFTTSLEPKNLLSTLLNSYSIMINTFFVPEAKGVDYLFYDEIDCGIVDLNKRHWKKAFEHGYASGTEQFSASSLVS